jgi:hypothetical protein
MQFLNKTATIDAKCELIADQLLQDYNNGTIKTETELLYRLKQAIMEFYSSIGKPTYRFKAAKSTPISQDYNGMITAANNDLKFIIEDCDNLTDAIKTSFVDTELNRTMMFNELRYIDKKLDEVKNRISTNNQDGIVVYTENFVNTDLMSNSQAVNSATINSIDGVLTLSVDTKKEYSSTAQVEILDGSNGFPGDTHTVDILNNNIHYTGENNLHLDLNSIVDGNNDTWFEYELFNVDDEIVEKCGGFGFNYKEGINWVTEDDVLKLRLKITLPTTPICNWLSLTPFIAEQRGVKPCFITSCIISDGATEMQEVKPKKVFDDNTVIIFKQQKVSYVILEFTQSASYEVNIGHNYFTKVNTLNATAFEEISDSVYSRVDGPMPSVELLGMKYDPKTKQCEQPKNYGDDNETFIDTAYIKKELFSIPADSEKVKADNEMLKGYRYSIGIKNISIANYSFESYSEYLSVPFTTEDIITSITLEADEMIPLEWNTSLDPKTQSNLVDSWIKYWIKVGDDNKWRQIFPKHRAFKGYCTYRVNNGGIDRYINKDYVQNAIGTINMLQDAQSVQLKIELSKPETDTYRTPIVFQYKLKILTGGENIEY